jgi:hypothetical protein
MACIMGTLFLGSIGLTQYLGVVAAPNETILSALAHRLVGSGLFNYIIQITTMLILAVAANTSFADFPRVGAILAKDGFLPHQLSGIGDRLVYSNGILLLSLGTAALIVIFRGNSHVLVPLFAVGAFLAFTLSQAGMVIHWRRIRGRAWQVKSMFNGLGATVTGATLIIVGVSKFSEGAWITILLIPSIVFVLMRIRGHYNMVARELSLHGLPPSLKPAPLLRAVIPISGVHRGIFDAVNLARAIASEVTAVYIELEPGAGESVRKKWQEWWPDTPLVVVPSPYRSIINPLLDYLDQTDLEHNDGQLAAVVLPEFVPAKWWHGLLHNQSAWLIKTAMLYRRRHQGFQRVIIDVPYHLRK